MLERLGRGVAIACALLPSMLAHAEPSAQGRTPISIEAVARYPFLSQVQLSSDGRHLVALTSLDGEERSISIWRTDALDQDPVRFGIGGTAAQKDVRFYAINWVADDRLLVTLAQPTRGSGYRNNHYSYLARIVNLDGSRWIDVMDQEQRYSFDFIGVLPNDPRHFLVEQWSWGAFFVYRVNVDTGLGERVVRLGGGEVAIPVVDSVGRVRIKRFVRHEDGDWRIGIEIFDPQANRWGEHPALGITAKQRRNMVVLAFDPTNPDLLIVLDDEGENFAYVRDYSISRRAFGETLFRYPRHDAEDVLIEHINRVPTRIVGFTYLDDTARPYWTDPAYRSLYEGLAAQMPGRRIFLGARNGAYRVVSASSSRHPTAYFLLENDRRLIPLGVSRRDVPSDQLMATELVRYTARDGLQIPAFLTLPFGWRRGDPPLPTIVRPHGGPWARDTADWDEINQFFASRGFAVLQPQFRGSTGFGRELWRAGDGQWGLAMQDDKDDGLRWLVEQGIADPDSALIYGFSYGGFAAMAATVRPRAPYRCAISGAGASSLERLARFVNANRIQRQYQGWTMSGLDPVEHAAAANIPILLYHGDHDQTVDLWHSERFAAALRARNKPHQFVVIEDMGHGASTPAMRRRELELVEAFIRGRCGISY